MKRRIDHFIRTYFYFNREERKGLTGLLLLIVLLQAVSFLYARYSENKMPEIKGIPFEKLTLPESSNEWDDSINFNHSPVSNFSGLKRNIFPINSYKKDTVNYLKNKKNQVVELNTADSAELVSLPKIGPVLAGRIIQYRERLGGFYSLGQLTEVWGFKEDMLYDLEGKLTLNDKLFKPVPINSVELNELKKHPYFKYTLSQAIVNYRSQHGKFQQLLDLKQIKIVNDSIYNLILPYCSLN